MLHRTTVRYLETNARIPMSWYLHFESSMRTQRWWRSFVWHTDKCGKIQNEQWVEKFTYCAGANAELDSLNKICKTIAPSDLFKCRARTRRAHFQRSWEPFHPFSSFSTKPAYFPGFHVDDADVYCLRLRLHWFRQGAYNCFSLWRGKGSLLEISQSQFGLSGRNWGIYSCKYNRQCIIKKIVYVCEDETQN